MGSYSGTVDRPQRAKAIAGVVAVHAALAAIILSGLNVTAVRRMAESMNIIPVVEPPEPKVELPPPAPKPEHAKREEGAPAKKAEPSPVVAPKPPIPVQSPLPAAPVAGTGSAPKAGAALAGNGTGAGGSGLGRGGGGFGDTSGFTPARLIHNLSRGDYRALTGGMLPIGSADVAIAITPAGIVGECRIIRSSGNGAIDSGLCPIVRQRLRFRPALDASGRPIGYRTNFHASWSLAY